MNSEDLKQIEVAGISEEKIDGQINSLKHGFEFLKIVQAAAVGNGILSVDKDIRSEAMAEWKNYLKHNSDIMKFVPASGAASRMFKELFEFSKSGDSVPDTEYLRRFFDEIENFAFFDALDDACFVNKGCGVLDLIDNEQYNDIVDILLYEDGLNYGSLPKGLLQFHRYDKEIRTAVEEHLVEGALYAKNSDDTVKIHFTVSPEHMSLFEELLSAVQHDYENRFNVKYDISFSVQKKSTDTVAIDSDGNLVRNDNGSILLRPGGHGALIENLNDLSNDIVFIKNIDNVVPDNFKQPTIDYKQIIGGILVAYRSKIYGYIRKLDNNVSDEELAEMLDFIEKKLNVHCEYIANKDRMGKIAYLKTKLNRPIRVCGIVKNEGEPGGGPYLVYDADGTISPQILESSQIDKGNSRALECMENATHFNPVDLVCCIRNYKNEKFNLLDHVDKGTGFISTKSKNGVDIKVLELPGLWNGAMSDWNTVFVEVPVETFNPVKSVNDLLREQHQ